MKVEIGKYSLIQIFTLLLLLCSPRIIQGKCVDDCTLDDDYKITNDDELYRNITKTEIVIFNTPTKLSQSGIQSVQSALAKFCTAALKTKYENTEYLFAEVKIQILSAQSLVSGGRRRKLRPFELEELLAKQSEDLPKEASKYHRHEKDNHLIQILPTRRLDADIPIDQRELQTNYGTALIFTGTINFFEAPSPPAADANALLLNQLISRTNAIKNFILKENNSELANVYSVTIGKPPTPSPTQMPNASPSKNPSKSPSKSPSKTPSKSPSKSPSKTPSKSPSRSPSKSPTTTPSQPPTKVPSPPTVSPKPSLSSQPSMVPSLSPSTPKASGGIIGGVEGPGNGNNNDDKKNNSVGLVGGIIGASGALIIIFASVLLVKRRNSNQRLDEDLPKSCSPIRYHTRLDDSSIDVLGDLETAPHTLPAKYSFTLADDSCDPATERCISPFECSTTSNTTQKVRNGAMYRVQPSINSSAALDDSSMIDPSSQVITHSPSATVRKSNRSCPSSPNEKIGISKTLASFFETGTQNKQNESPVTPVIPSKVTQDEFEKDWEDNIPFNWNPLVTSPEQMNPVSTDENIPDGSFPTFEMVNQGTRSPRPMERSRGYTSDGGSSSYVSATGVHPLDWSNYDGTSLEDSTLSESNVNKSHTEQDKSRSFNTTITSGVYMTPMSEVSPRTNASAKSGQSSAYDSTSPSSKQLINDLVWLEKKIADVRSRVNRLDSTNSRSPSPNNRSPMSKSSVGSPSSYSQSPISKNIVTRECIAPPGKLQVVINSTKDGPSVQTVRSGSVLEGKVFPGDLIAAVDDIDTRSFSAEAVMELMMKRNAHERKLTIYRFDA